MHLQRIQLLLQITPMIHQLLILLSHRVHLNLERLELAVKLVTSQLSIMLVVLKVRTIITSLLLMTHSLPLHLQQVIISGPCILRILFEAVDFGAVARHAHLDCV